MNPAHAPTILVVEDDAAVRQTLVDMVEFNGYRVISAPDGTAGLALALHELPALILTDIEMPGLNGYELLEKIRHDDTLRATPVIMLTAKMDRAANRRGMELGADDFITKPFSEQEVIRSIRTRLEKKELLDELDSFAHTVAHDLKNPLATLNGRLYLLEDAIGRGDTDLLRKHAHEANVSATRLAAIINELLLLAGVRRQRIVTEEIAMAPIVAEAVGQLGDLLTRTGATVTLPAHWPTAFGYAPWVVHLWANFISNAAKYAGPAAAITLGAELHPDGRHSRFWVQDRGPGLDATAQAAMFVPFTRISTIRAQGHGLGLSIARRIAEKLDGRVGVDSQPGRGARFWFELPTTRPTPPPPILFR
jgi:two-component system sensor histidine kinase/response regulator